MNKKIQGSKLIFFLIISLCGLCNRCLITVERINISLSPENMEDSSLKNTEENISFNNKSTSHIVLEKIQNNLKEAYIMELPVNNSQQDAVSESDNRTQNMLHNIKTTTENLHLETVNMINRRRKFLHPELTISSPILQNKTLEAAESSQPLVGEKVYLAPKLTVKPLQNEETGKNLREFIKTLEEENQ